MFRHGPILTGGSYKGLFRFVLFSTTKWSVFTCYGGEDEQCSTPRGGYAWCWGGVEGGMGRDNYKRCSCVEEECETLWLLSRTMCTPRARLVLSNELSKVIRKYDKEAEDKVIVGTQLLDRTWQELKKYVAKNLATNKKNIVCSTLKSGNGFTVFNGDSTQELNCGKNVQKFSTAQTGKMPESNCERRKKLRLPPRR